MSVYVVDVEGTPLLPTNPARARILLKKGKAAVYTVEPFTIQLNRKVEKPKGEFKIGIDDGSKYVGISVGYRDKVVFAGTIRLRQDVHRKMLQRAQYRRARRTRKVRHRKQRFLNRRGNKIPPTINQKKESVLRVVDDLKKRLNITQCVVEQGQFDVSSMSKDYNLTGKDYQKSEYEGSNWRQKVLWRDKYACRKCKSKNDLQAHHIWSKSQGGTNIITNGITLCEKCHRELHGGQWTLKAKSGGHFKYPTHLQQGKWYLFNELKERFSQVNVIFGWMTARLRSELGLEKEHYCDASAMIRSNKFNCYNYVIIPRKTKTSRIPTKKCSEKEGFKHWDIIKSQHRTKGIVIGCIRSLKSKVITVRTSFDDNFSVSYKKSYLIWRPDSLVYYKHI